MREQRGKQAAASFLFKLAESVGTQGISFVVSVVLARLLDPSDYGVLTMLTVFIAVSQVFVQSGLNTALIQKKDVDETDLSSVFYVSLGIAVVLYGLLFLLVDASVLKIAEGLNCSVSPVQDDAQQEKEDTQDGKSKHHNGIV